MADRGSLYVEAQDTIKEELTMHFLGEEFSWIDDILPENEKDEEEEGIDG